MPVVEFTDFGSISDFVETVSVFWGRIMSNLADLSCNVAGPFIKILNDLPEKIERSSGQTVKLNCKALGTSPMTFE